MSPKRVPGAKGAGSKDPGWERQATGKRKGRRRTSDHADEFERRRRRARKRSVLSGALEDAEMYADDVDEVEELDFDHSPGVYSVSGFQDDATYDDHADYDERFLDEDLDFLN